MTRNTFLEPHRERIKVGKTTFTVGRSYKNKSQIRLQTKEEQIISRLDIIIAYLQLIVKTKKLNSPKNKKIK